MFCSKLIRGKKSFLSMKNLVSKMGAVRQMNSTCVPCSTRLFSTVPIKSTEVENEPPKKLIEKRSDVDEKIVKRYLSLINTCDLRKFYYADETKKLLSQNVLLLPGELSSCISYMYRIGLSKLVLQVFRYYDKNGLFGLLNVTSVKYIMLCCVKENDPTLLNHVYNTLNSKRKSSIVLNSTYIRCLLSLNNLNAATELLSSYLNSPIYKNTTVLGKNDIYSNVIVGFYEGKYFSRCLATFHSLRPENGIVKGKETSKQMKQTKQIKTPEQTNETSIREENWKSIQTSHCYSAVIGSAYRLQDAAAVLKYYDECRSFSLFPNFLESMMVAQTIADSEEYKVLYDQLQIKKDVIRGVPEIEKEKYLLNLSRVAQTRKALRQVYWNWHYYRNQKPKHDVRSDTISIYTGDLEDVGSCLSVLATLYNLKAITSHELVKTKILVKTGSNAESLQQLVDYFENELYPVLPYEIEDNRVILKAADVQMWVKTRRNISLELR